MLSQFNPKGFHTASGLIVAKIYFLTDQWETLSPDAEKTLDKLIAHYGSLLRGRHKIKLTFVGRADKRASHHYNWLLAMGRSITTRAYVDRQLIPLGGYTADSFSTGELHSGDKLTRDRRVDVYLGLNKRPPPRPPTPNQLERAKQLLKRRKELEKKIIIRKRWIKNLRTWLEPDDLKKTDFLLNLIGKIVAGGRGDPYAAWGLGEALEKDYDVKMQEAIPGKIKKYLQEIHKLIKEIKKIDSEVARLTQGEGV